MYVTLHWPLWVAYNYTCAVSLVKFLHKQVYSFWCYYTRSFAQYYFQIIYCTCMQIRLILCSVISFPHQQPIISPFMSSTFVLCKSVLLCFCLWKRCTPMHAVRMWFGVYGVQVSLFPFIQGHSTWLCVQLLHCQKLLPSSPRWASTSGSPAPLTLALTCFLMSPCPPLHTQKPPTPSLAYLGLIGVKNFSLVI